jgi:hypothetical protein
VTDKLRSYRHAHGERRMGRLRSTDHAQRFPAVHGRFQNLFAIPRRLMRARNHRLFRVRAFDLYAKVTCA